jgi:teichuronic acid biosynthesis glycosyltransferase TuaC
VSTSPEPPPIDALVVTNMWPTPERPAFGRFVYDQVRALRALNGVTVEVETIAGGSPGRYVHAARDLRRRFRGRDFDVVHAHFGLSAWPALAVPARVHAVTLHGTDLVDPRSRAITVAALPLLDLVAVVSADLRGRVPGWAPARARRRGGGVQVLPCGVDLERFRPLARREARQSLGLDPDRRYVLFGADPARPEKRYDLARELVDSMAAPRPELLALGAVDPERVPLWVNAADVVLVPSDREGFGLATLEALACDVPVLATPHGVAPEALAGVEGAYCGPFSLDVWGSALAAQLSTDDPRLDGRAVAERYSAGAMAGLVAASWRAALAGTCSPSG